MEQIEEFLQDKYKEYVTNYKKNYYDISYMNYDEWYRMSEEYHELEVCSNCNEVVPNDYGTQTEHDGFLCKDCINSGYGR